jgi:hypothetical protein
MPDPTLARKLLRFPLAVPIAYHHSNLQYPLKMSRFANELDDGKYAYSWYENAQDDVTEVSIDGGGDASGAGLTSHI